MLCRLTSFRSQGESLSMALKSSTRRLCASPGRDQAFRELSNLQMEIRTVRYVGRIVRTQSQPSVITLTAPSASRIYAWQPRQQKRSSASSVKEKWEIVGKALSLEELQKHLPSTTFEDVLQASLQSYIRRRPKEYRYCPTPDCDYCYRATNTTNLRTCPKCLKDTCTAWSSATRPHELATIMRETKRLRSTRGRRESRTARNVVHP